MTVSLTKEDQDNLRYARNAAGLTASISGLFAEAIEAGLTGTHGAVSAAAARRPLAAQRRGGKTAITVALRAPTYHRLRSFAEAEGIPATMAAVTMLAMATSRNQDRSELHRLHAIINQYRAQFGDLAAVGKVPA